MSSKRSKFLTSMQLVGIILLMCLLILSSGLLCELFMSLIFDALLGWEHADVASALGTVIYCGVLSWLAIRVVLNAFSENKDNE